MPLGKSPNPTRESNFKRMTEVYTFGIQFWFLQMSVNLKTQQCKPSKMKYREEKRNNEHSNSKLWDNFK